MNSSLAPHDISVTSCAVGAAIYRLNGPQQVDVASMFYRKGGRFTSRRLIMETSKPGQSVRATLEHGVMSEAADPEYRDSFRIISITDEPVACAFGPDQTNSEGTHLKLIYGVEVIGDLWKGHHFDEEDLDEEHWDLSYDEAEETVRRMEISKCPPIHRKGVLGIVDFLARKHSPVAMRYMRMLSREPISISDGDMRIIRRYLEQGY